VGPKAALDNAVKRKFLILLGLELRPLGRPALGWSLYRLRYPGSSIYQVSRKYSVRVLILLDASDYCSCIKYSRTPVIGIN
jgi:hypothetical protein